MLNKQEIAVLRALLMFSSDGGYKVLDADDILEELGELSITKATLLQIITGLSSREVITIKLANIEQYILAALPKAQVVINDIDRELKIIERNAKAKVASKILGKKKEVVKINTMIALEEDDDDDVVIIAKEEEQIIKKSGLVKDITSRINFIDRWVRPIIIAIVAGLSSGIMVGIICK